jgi:hypothetical protein
LRRNNGNQHLHRASPKYRDDVKPIFDSSGRRERSKLL